MNHSTPMPSRHLQDRPLTMIPLFESPVWSGLLTPRGFNRDRNQSTLFPEVKKTGLDHKRSWSAVFLQSLDWFQSAPVLTSL
ncbi:uncharacterized protein LACBIDRAFT_299259 [Laccaria bicolor S238N-H82]|uniref:Predicted protein n=1 Tax=Laccaria bicolor (strain S238N-H82 / ATCC MYA-4686) TaxID=486041 RepID=B0DEC9_LACBS|nr:uncharacterized protein LACBIDRAFT_299259 [Laccaria bicolor S238N-H82]EDR06910.1 predicted protein [Laccaria bicolor S238N-H82]|eukprot:XP_001882283.1 predicted protein [Laccaria bicolor S238N-H82]